MNPAGAVERPTFAPYAGRHGPFSISLAPLAEEDWLHIDGNRAAELSEKRALFAQEDDTFRAEPGTEDAQAEVAALVADHLVRRGFAAAAPSGMPPLMAAALTVQDDLVLMRRREGAWHLVAAALCFPSAWRLAEKFAQPMDAIHESVPHWERMGGRVARIFDNLAADQIVWRLNWSIQEGDHLRDARAGSATRFGARRAPFVRVERQTLRKLPQSGDILFTIRIFLDPFTVLAAQPNRAELASHLAARIGALSAQELAYKGLLGERDAVLDALGAVAAGGAG